jgi:hypothetical protein
MNVSYEKATEILVKTGIYSEEEGSDTFALLGVVRAFCGTDRRGRMTRVRQFPREGRLDKYLASRPAWHGLAIVGVSGRLNHAIPVLKGYRQGQDISVITNDHGLAGNPLRYVIRAVPKTVLVF